MAVPSQPAGTQRLFTALWPDDAVRDAIAREQGRWQWPAQAARVRAERLHLTLHFLGNVDESRLPSLRDAMRVGFEPFDLSLEKSEVWGNGVAVLAPHATAKALAALHSRLGEALAAIGLPPESRAYRPHVTLARRAFGASPPAQAHPVLWVASEGFVLVRTMPGTGRYEILERYA